MLSNINIIHYYGPILEILYDDQVTASYLLVRYGIGIMSEGILAYVTARGTSIYILKFLSWADAVY